MDKFGALHGGWSCSCSSGPESIRTPVMVSGEAVWAVGGVTIVRAAQAMLPELHDKPTPEPDDEDEDDPENESKDEPEDEDEPQDKPDTLYFGREDGCTARSCRSPHHAPAARRRWARVPPVCPSGGLYIATPFF